MTEQIVDGGFVGGLDLQVSVVDIQRQQVLAFQAGTDALTVAILAPVPQEAMLQDPALEEIVELALHVVRQ
jgi:hypothetical protein